VGRAARSSEAWTRNTAFQTRESSEWDREFRNRQTPAEQRPDLPVQASAALLISAECGDELKGIKLAQGKCKEPRKLLYTSERSPARWRK